MPAVKIRRDEFEILKEAAGRVERRSGSRFIMDKTQVEVTDEGSPASAEGSKDEQEIKPPVVFD